MFGKKRSKSAIIRITVGYDKGDRFSVIDSKDELKRFAALWESKTKVDHVDVIKLVAESVSIDVAVADSSTRWIYHPEGFTWVLSKRIGPVYEVADVAEMNAILGVG